MATAQEVLKQLQDDFPKQDAKWVLNSDVSWAPVTDVPVGRIDLSNMKQWNATSHTAKLKVFQQKIKNGDRKPVILAKVPDNGKLVVLDGHHRVLASQKLNVPVRAYVCTISGASEEPALEMHAAQRRGNSGPMKQRDLKFTAETPIASTVHHPFGKPGGPGLWHMKGVQLPAYIQNVAHALIRSGSASDESDAIHKAVGIVQDWARGKATHGKSVTPDVQAAAQNAMSEWYQKRGERATRTASKTFDHSNMYNLGFHKAPAIIRRVKKHLENQGVPKTQSLQQTVQLFKQWAKDGKLPPVIQEAAPLELKALARRKSKVTKGKSAGGDTGSSYKEANFSNAHHDGVGKFAGNVKERERILKTFQEQHLLPVTGVMDEKTRMTMQAMTKPADEH